MAKVFFNSDSTKQFQMGNDNTNNMWAFLKKVLYEGFDSFTFVKGEVHGEALVLFFEDKSVAGKFGYFNIVTVSGLDGDWRVVQTTKTSVAVVPADGQSLPASPLATGTLKLKHGGWELLYSDATTFVVKPQNQPRAFAFRVGLNTINRIYYIRGDVRFFDEFSVEYDNRIRQNVTNSSVMQILTLRGWTDGKSFHENVVLHAYRYPYENSNRFRGDSETNTPLCLEHCGKYNPNWSNNFYSQYWVIVSDSMIHLVYYGITSSTRRTGYMCVGVGKDVDGNDRMIITTSFTGSRILNSSDENISNYAGTTFGARFVHDRYNRRFVSTFVELSDGKTIVISDVASPVYYSDLSIADSQTKFGVDSILMFQYRPLYIGPISNENFPSTTHVIPDVITMNHGHVINLSNFMIREVHDKLTFCFPGVSYSTSGGYATQSLSIGIFL